MGGKSSLRGCAKERSFGYSYKAWRNVEDIGTYSGLLYESGSAYNLEGKFVRPTREFGALKSPDGNVMWGSNGMLRNFNSHENGGSIFFRLKRCQQYFWFLSLALNTSPMGQLILGKRSLPQSRHDLCPREKRELLQVRYDLQQTRH